MFQIDVRYPNVMPDIPRDAQPPHPSLELSRRGSVFDCPDILDVARIRLGE